MATRTRRSLAAVALLAGLLAGCSDDAGGAPDPDPAVGSRTTGASPSATGTGTAEATTDPSQRDEPEALDWQQVPGPADVPVTRSGRWALAQHEDRAVLDGPERIVVEAPAHHRVSHALLDEQYAVVVAEDELAERPDTATVVELATGQRTVLDARADVPTTVGGTWALGEGRLLHATVDGQDYCLAEVDLVTGAARTRWCAPARHGFSDARITPAGTSLLTFDDARPSCRTVVTLGDDDEVEPLAGVPDCLGWDGLVLGDGVAVWSVVPKPRTVEEAVLAATTPDGTVELGAGTSGSLTWCGGAAWWVRDPQRSDEPARLVRWSPDAGASTAYETEARGRAFLTEPRCGGDALTVTALTEEGDEQVTAGVG